MSETRKIAAILVADVVGYSRLASEDEDRTLSRLRGRGRLRGGGRPKRQSDSATAWCRRRAGAAHRGDEQGQSGAEDRRAL
jgi:hypothetical protein